MPFMEKNPILHWYSNFLLIAFFFYIFDHTYISHLDYGAVYEHELDILNIC